MVQFFTLLLCFLLMPSSGFYIPYSCWILSAVFHYLFFQFYKYILDVLISQNNKSIPHDWKIPHVKCSDGNKIKADISKEVFGYKYSRGWQNATKINATNRYTNVFKAFHSSARTEVALVGCFCWTSLRYFLPFK